VGGWERRGLRDLMARMGHDSEHAAIIYQHEARGADAAITDAIDAHVESEQGKGAMTVALPGPSSKRAHRHVNGTQASSGLPRAGCQGPAWAADLGFYAGAGDGAGDGNRTRTISLGSLWRCSPITC
jgi:hypothetical protein